MITHVGMFDDAIKAEKQERKIKKLKKRIVELMVINKEHQTINGKLRSELEIEKKNHALSVEALELEVRLKDKELGRMMKKLQN